jgi:hypothetical protein
MKEVTFNGNDNEDQFVVVGEQEYPLGQPVVVNEDDAKSLDDLDGFTVKQATKSPADGPSSSNSAT